MFLKRFLSHFNTETFDTAEINAINGTITNEVEY